MPNLYTLAATSDHEVNGVLIKGSWRVDMITMLPVRHVPWRFTNYCQRIRHEIADYCMNEGFLE